MPITNPRRVFTKVGKIALLNALFDVDTSGPFTAWEAYLVRAITIDPLTDNVTDVTLNAFGLQTGIAMGTFNPPQTHNNGKVYTYCSVMQGTVTAPTEPQTVIGVMVGESADPANAGMFLEFDDPIILDMTGEKIIFSIETGFDGQKLYAIARVLPLGE